MDRLLTLLTSCDERRYEQWELQSWWVYVQAEQRSDAFQKFLADGLTRTLVAARAREISARTGGLILAQLLFDLARAGGRADRVLDAPTNEAWIDPWVAHLRAPRRRPAARHAGRRASRCATARIAGVTTPAGTVTADYYVAALPVEIMRTLRRAAAAARSSRACAALDRLVTRWMNGILFYLDRDVPLVHGHAIYIDSEWALTSISQAQFWPGVDLERYGDGRVKGILSVDVSDWETPGRRTGKVAARCSREEIRDEVWGQLDRPPQRRPAAGARRAPRAAWFLDPAIEFPNPTRRTNLEPLLDQHGRLVGRPARTPPRAIPNLLLAADYVRTNTDLATMEGANEAARRAVNAILDARRPRATRARSSRCASRRCSARRGAGRLRWRLGHRAGPRAAEGGAADGALEPRACCRPRRAGRRRAAQSATRVRPAAARPPRAPRRRTPAPARSLRCPRRRVCAAQAMMSAVSPYGSGPESCTSGAGRRRRRRPARRPTRRLRRPRGRPPIPPRGRRPPGSRRACPAPSWPASRPGWRACSGRASGPNQPR